MSPTSDPSERHVPQVVQLLDFNGVVGEDVEEIAPPATHSPVAVVAAFHGGEARLDLDLIVGERQRRVEVAAVEDLIQKRWSRTDSSTSATSP
jgi:hypothetical protein